MDDAKARESNRLRQKKYLEQHREEVNEKRREKYHERQSKGKCPRCGQKVKKGHSLCADCCDYMQEINRQCIIKRKKTALKKPAPKKAASKKTADGAAKVNRAKKA